MTTHRSTPMAVAALLFLSLACGPAPAGLSGTSDAVAADAPRQALDVADSVLSANVEEAGPVEGFWPFLAEDAVFLEPGLAIVQGRDAIRAALSAAQPEGPSPLLRLHRVSANRSEDGKLGFTYGWTELIPAGGTVAYGKYLAMWRRNAGHWRLEAFARAASFKAPTPPPDGNPVIAGYHGFAIPGDAAELAADVAATDSAFAALAEAQSTCVAFPAFADENAVVFGGNNFRYGMDWVRIAYSGCVPESHATWAPVSSASTGSGDLGWSVGNATFWYDDGTSVSYSYSKYLTLWARQADGTWKWLGDTGSARP